MLGQPVADRRPKRGFHANIAEFEVRLKQNFEKFAAKKSKIQLNFAANLPRFARKSPKKPAEFDAQRAKIAVFPVHGLPSQVQAVAPTLVAHQPALDQPIEGIKPLDDLQKPFQGDLPSILVLPEGGGTDTYDSGNTKIEANLSMKSDFLSLSKQGIQKSNPKLDNLDTMLKGVPKNSNNKRKENSSNLYNMINNVKIEPILTSQKLIDYIISCGLKDFKKRKKLSN